MVFRRKLPRASFVLLTLSVASAIGAAAAMQAYAARLDAMRPDGGAPIRVVVAARDLARGSIVTSDAVETATMPSRFVPPRALRDAARAEGRTLVADIAAGEVVTQLRLAGGASGPTASLVPAGLRAVRIPVAASVGARPGDRVDVLATFGGGGAHTELAGEALEVLRVERRGAGASFGGAGATGTSGAGLVLLVAPDHAERLAFAATFATLSIAVIGVDELVPVDPATPVPSMGGG